MSAFLAELGRRLAERWMSLLVLPGLVYVGTLAAAAEFGRWRWTWIGAVAHRVTAALADAGIARSAAGGVVAATLVLGVMLMATVAGLVAQVLSGPVERVCVGRWPRWASPLARSLTGWRQRRWRRADRRLSAQLGGEDATAEGTGEATAEAPRRPSRAELTAARNRIALEPPSRPTWIGDRLDAADARIWNEYGLDLTFCWSRLWLVIPDTSRQAVQASRDRFTAATLVGAWAVLYAGLGVLWWPSLFAAALVGIVGWRRTRAAAEVLADLVEAIVDVHSPDLAKALGVPIEGNRVVPHVGRQISERLHKAVQRHRPPAGAGDGNPAPAGTV